MTKRASSVASNYDPELFIQFLNDFGKQYANSYRAACNAEHRYQTGKLPPHYPVPAILGTTHIYPECVVIYTPDLVDGVPGITWWNESYGIPLPDDHGIWAPN